MDKKNEYEIEEVIIRIKNLNLWKYRKSDVIPHHKFRLEIWNYGNNLLFGKDMVAEGRSTDFEFRESALVCIKNALKLTDKNLIPQSEDEGDKFPRFLEEFNDKLNKIMEYGQPDCTLF